MQISRRSFEVVLFTSTRRIEGTFEPLGDLLIDLNNAERKCVPITKARIAPLDPASPLRPMSVPQAMIPKQDILFFFSRDEDLIDEMRLLPRVEQLVVYTAAFVVRGGFHLGVEQHVHDMMDTIRGRFFPVTDATVFPLVRTRVPTPRAQKLILLNLDTVELYHLDLAAPGAL